jgi:hypothetical protein
MLPSGQHDGIGNPLNMSMANLLNPSMASSLTSTSANVAPLPYGMAASNLVTPSHNIMNNIHATAAVSLLNAQRVAEYHQLQNNVMTAAMLGIMSNPSLTHHYMPTNILPDMTGALNGMVLTNDVPTATNINVVPVMATIVSAEPSPADHTSMDTSADTNSVAHIDDDATSVASVDGAPSTSNHESKSAVRSGRRGRGARGAASAAASSYVEEATIAAEHQQQRRPNTRGGRGGRGGSRGRGRGRGKAILQSLAGDDDDDADFAPRGSVGSVSKTARRSALERKQAAAIAAGLVPPSAAMIAAALADDNNDGPAVSTVNRRIGRPPATILPIWTLLSIHDGRIRLRQSGMVRRAAGTLDIVREAQRKTLAIVAKKVGAAGKKATVSSRYVLYTSMLPDLLLYSII